MRTSDHQCCSFYCRFHNFRRTNSTQFAMVQWHKHSDEVVAKSRKKAFRWVCSGNKLNNQHQKNSWHMRAHKIHIIHPEWRIESFEILWTYSKGRKLCLKHGKVLQEMQRILVPTNEDVCQTTIYKYLQSINICDIHTHTGIYIYIYIHSIDLYRLYTFLYCLYKNNHPQQPFATFLAHSHLGTTRQCNCNGELPVSRHRSIQFFVRWLSQFRNAQIRWQWKL